MILCDSSLRALIPSMIRDYDESLINPASIDIRIGRKVLYESVSHIGEWMSHDLVSSHNFWLAPGQFVLVDTYEYITIPNGYAAHLYLKSSIARQGYNHNLAFWVDPGWSGVLTMEIQNTRSTTPLLLTYGMRFAQIVVQMLDHPSKKPYNGKYQHATTVESSKDSEKVRDND